MQRPTIFLALLVTLVLALSMVVVVPALAQPTFTGNVEVDFTGPGILIIQDPHGVGDVGLPGNAPNGTISGWDIRDLRLYYHAATDTMYIGINVGLNASTILGDADGDGDPGGASSWLATNLGGDLPNLGESETVAVYFDLNQDGTWDVIAGISGSTNYTGFSVNVFTGAILNPPVNFGMPLPANKGVISPSPNATCPDLEFTITRWSELPGHDASVGFTVGAFLGSQQDDGIGEDSIEPTSFTASIDVEKLVSKDNVNFVDADTAQEALKVNVGDNVYFRYIVTNTGNVTLTSITLSDNVYNVSSIVLIDPLAPGVSFNGTIGPITVVQGLHMNVATATGVWQGFTVREADPACYSSLPAVGGTAFKVNKLRLLAPWGVLLGCAGIVTLIILRRKRPA